VRTWIEANAPRAKRTLSLEKGKAWQRKLHEGGFLGAAWPKEYGGAGLSDMEQAIHRGRHQRDPEEHHRRAHPGPSSLLTD
jgi:alkylation response protein AidB-like acyl-CoA dehydrogenase